jgi:hypothetical protein
MTGEYTIHLTVRETDEGLHIESQNNTGSGDSYGSIFAKALFGAIKREVRTMKAKVEASAAAESSKTIH